MTLAEIGAEVVKLAGAGVCRDRFGFAVPGRDLRNPTGRRVDQDPVVLAEGVAVGVGVVNDLAAGGRGLSFEPGKLIEAVLGRVCRDLCPDRCGDRGVEINLAEEAVGHVSSGHMPWPAHDHRHPMAPLPEIAFQPSKGPHAAVAEGPRPLVGVAFRAVVGGEDHERVGSESPGFERVEHPADGVVGLGEKIPVGAGSRAALEGFRRQDRRVGGGEGEVEEEGAVGGLLLNPGHGPVGERRHDGVEVPARHTRAGAAFPVSLGGLSCRDEVSRRRDRDPIILEPSIGGEVRNVVAEVTIEAMSERAPRDLPPPVEIGGGKDFVFSLDPRRRTGPADRLPVPAEMPLPDSCGGVATAAEEFGECRPLGVEDRLVERLHDPVELPPVIAAMKEGIAARRADPRRTVGVGEPGSFAHQSIEVRGRDFRVGVVGPEVAVAHVVGIEDDDVGKRGIGGRARCRPDDDRGDEEQQGAGRETVHGDGACAGGGRIGTAWKVRAAIPLLPRRTRSGCHCRSTR